MTFETKKSDKARNTNSQTQCFQRIWLFEIYRAHLLAGDTPVPNAACGRKYGAFFKANSSFEPSHTTSQNMTNRRNLLYFQGVAAVFPFTTVEYCEGGTGLHTPVALTPSVRPLQARSPFQPAHAPASCTRPGCGRHPNTPVCGPWGPLSLSIG